MAQGCATRLSAEILQLRYKTSHFKTRVPGLSCRIICVILRLAVFTTRRLAKRGICRRRVSVCVCVCHTPVLYQNG